jgi:CubicO group peptidase (beta-lactamase class C family)
MAAPPAAPGTHAETDPAVLKWMVGSPPPEDKVVLQEDLGFFTFPKTRWTFAHMREVVPTTRVWRGDGPRSTFQRNLRTEEIDQVSFTPIRGDKPMTWKESLDANYTDAILVMHKGTIVYETYRGVMKPHGHHSCFSVTKSFFGTIAEQLIVDGLMDENALVTKYIPELGNSAYADATVRNVMDMRIGVEYTEDYNDPNAGESYSRPSITH